MLWLSKPCLWGLVSLFIVAEGTTAEELVPSPRLPATSPWNLSELSQPPKMSWVDEAGPVRSLMYTGEPYNGQPTEVFAYYATPETLTGEAMPDRKFPAVVLVHGGGGTAFREWAELWAKRGYAAIAMDLAGHRPIEGKNAHAKENRTRLPDGAPDQGDDEKFGSIDKAPTEQWPYHAVADVIRAHSLIRSFNEVDGDHIAVTGISWGGYLTCIVAGVDTRFEAAVPVYGCGFLYENSAWLDRLNRMTPEQRARWIELWDPSRYLPAVTMPILFVNGTNDFAYPLDSYMRSYQAVPGVKQLRVTVNLPHGHPPGWAPVEISLFIDHYLRAGVPLPKLMEPELQGDIITAAWDSPTKLIKGELHFTTGTEPINKRTWETVAADLGDSMLTVKAPPGHTTAWFLTITDERQATISSPIVIHAIKPAAE
ncbi:alpha/beta fold hydrolase [bacterium]|nr:alpha/beta fold hydrolase [bacterium]